MHTRPRMSAYILAIHTRRAVKTLLATQIIQCAEKKFGGGDCWRFRTTGRCVEFFFRWRRIPFSAGCGCCGFGG